MQLQFLLALAATVLATDMSATPVEALSSTRPFAKAAATNDFDFFKDGQHKHNNNYTGQHAPAYPHWRPEYHEVKARDNKVLGVYVCKGPGWTNSCAWQTLKVNVCMLLPPANTVSVGPDIGVQCMLFEGNSCAYTDTHTSGSLVAPGSTALSNGFDGLPDGTPPKSYMCRLCGKGNENCGSPGQIATWRWKDLPGGPSQGVPFW